MVFLWDASPDGKDKKGALDRLTKRAGKELSRVERLIATAGEAVRRRGVMRRGARSGRFRGESAREADTRRHYFLRLRVGAGSDEPDKKPMPGCNPPTICRVSARLRAGDGVLCGAGQVRPRRQDRSVPVGRAEVTPIAEEGEHQAVRSRPSLPIFTAEAGVKARR